MKRNLGSLGISVLISLAGSVAILNWLVNDDASKSFLVQVSQEEKKSGIKNLDIEFKNKNVVLNIFLEKPMTCDEVFDVLGVEDLPLRGKVYSPVCTSIKPEKIVITYKEMVKT